MFKRPKMWRSLSAAALAGTASIALLAACDAPKQASGKGEGKMETPAGSSDASAASKAADTGMQHTMPSPAVAGAGEGEGGAAKMADLSTDNVAYLSQLSMVKGHLLAGVELYKQGARDMAKVHMKHPQDELIKDLEPALAARKAPGFGTELTALADAVNGDAPVETVDAAHQAVVKGIDAAERAGTADTLQDAKSVVQLVEQIVRVAASEYAMAVVDGKVVNPKEYQDAYGFTQVAKQRMAALGAADTKHIETRSKVQAQLDSLDPAWPGIVPPDTVKTDASLLYGAAARIQIAGLSL